MKTITKYKAVDGTEFIEISECLQHESNLTQVAEIMGKLPNKPYGSDFSNGSGYIQHDSKNLLNVRNLFLKFCKVYCSHRWLQETIDKGFGVHFSFADRVLSESLPTSMRKYLYRFNCIDDQFREWGQPYYASNPEKAKQVKFNKD